LTWTFGAATCDPGCTEGNTLTTAANAPAVPAPANNVRRDNLDGDEGMTGLIGWNAYELNDISDIARI
jgi:hypothetical protein